MPHSEKFLKARGVPCTISTSGSPSSYVSLKRVSSTTNPSTRNSYWEGLALLSPTIPSGEYFLIGSNKYLTLTSYPDLSSGSQVISVVSVNSQINISYLSETADSNGDISYTWSTRKSGVDAYLELSVGALRQVNVGLLSSTVCTVILPKSIGTQILDRVTIVGSKYQVDAIDGIGMEGVVRLQLSGDERG